MKLSYTETDKCPVSLELTVEELAVLIKMTKDSDVTGAWRVKEPLKEAYREAVAAGIRSFEYQRRYNFEELGIDTDDDSSPKVSLASV